MGDAGRIVCAVDFAEDGEKATSRAVQLARDLHAELHLVHVYNLPVVALPDGAVLAGPTVAVEVVDGARAALSRCAATLRGQGIDVEEHLLEGIPHEEIGKLARTLDAQMIVMGTHGRTGVAHFLMGSVAERVVRTAPCPVLTVRLES